MLQDKSFKVERVGSKKAVAKAIPSDAMLPPFFLVMESEGWKIDLAFLMDHVRYQESGWKWTNKKAPLEWRKR